MTRSSAELSRLSELWGIELQDVAGFFGVSVQDLDTWSRVRVPASHQQALADLSAATGLLARHVRRNRIPAVVRRPSEHANHRSLLELAESGQHGLVLSAVTRMFDLRRIQP